ncbi:MAG: hypothetical protein J5778_04720 [Clostridiales bacterium]|nr:hypothetical protein [Clostridiales bacterium]
MYVHIEDDKSIPLKQVSAVVDLSTADPASGTIARFMRSEDEAGRLQYLTRDIPESLVIADDKTYVCSISASVLLKRLESL